MADRRGGAAGSGRGQRDLRTRLKTARGRKLSSTLWLDRQLNDPYVKRAQSEGYRSRAAFKLLEIDDKLKFLKPGMRVVDLGAAPGGWCQIAVDRVNALGRKPNAKVGYVLGVDQHAIEPIPGATLLKRDFLDADADEAIFQKIDGWADIVLSDMAAPSMGHKQTDHLKIMALCEAAAEFAGRALRTDGVFAAKTLQGGADRDLLAMLKRDFKKVTHVKPPASRKDSAEMYVVAQGFRKGT